MADAVIARRAILRAIPALALASSAPAALAASGEPPSRLSELIADHAWRMAESEELNRQADELDMALVRPELGIEVFVRVHTAEGLEERPRRLYNREEVEGFWPIFGFHSEDARQRILVLREEKVAEVEAIRAERLRINEESGLDALEERCEMASDAEWAARIAIFAHQPTTMAEVAEKNAFLRRLMVGDHIDARHLWLIFGGDPDGFAGLAAERRWLTKELASVA